MNQAQLSLLALRHVVYTLRLAVDAISLAEVKDVRALELAGHVRRRAEEVELSTAALLLAGGLTWEALAEVSGVTKQSLHRRLSTRLNRAIGGLTTDPQAADDLGHLWDRSMDALRRAIADFESMNAKGHAQQVVRKINRLGLGNNQ